MTRLMATLARAGIIGLLRSTPLILRTHGTCISTLALSATATAAGIMGVPFAQSVTASSN